MTNTRFIDNRELVECEICLKEIPISEAKNQEASDYVFYFCGQDCFEKWRNSEDEAE
ncbi:MAG TPA: DUF3330 domain-containing protein [Gammaproteobacteria bacterium]